MERPEPTELKSAQEQSLQQLAEKPQPSRRPWRTLVRVDAVDNERQFFYVVVPAWSTRTKVRINMKDIPENIKKLVQPDHRFHAHVNTGATNASDLFFDKWEVM